MSSLVNLDTNADILAQVAASMMNAKRNTMSNNAISDERAAFRDAARSFKPVPAKRFSASDAKHLFRMQNQKTSKAQADNVELLMTAATALTSLTGIAQTQSQSQTQKPQNVMNTMQSLPPSTMNAAAPAPAPRRTSTRKKATRFPVKLMQMLSAGQFEHIISWTPDGLSFVVKKPSLLVDEVLPLYFKEVKYTSFTRKLHRWGFVKILRGKELSAYLHKNFQRGNLRLCEQMHCSKTSGLSSGHGAVSSASTEVSRSSANRPIKNAPMTAENSIIAGAISTARSNTIHQVDDGEMYGQEQEQHLLQMHERLRQQQAAMTVVNLPPAPPPQNRQQLFNMSQILMQQQQEEQQRRHREQALMQQRAQIQMQMQLANEFANGLNAVNPSAPPQMAAHEYDFVRARHAMQHQRIIENAWNVLSQEQSKGNLPFSPSGQGQTKLLRNINMNYPPSA